MKKSKIFNVIIFIFVILLPAVFSLIPDSFVNKEDLSFFGSYYGAALTVAGSIWIADTTTQEKETSKMKNCRKDHEKKNWAFEDFWKKNWTIILLISVAVILTVVNIITARCFSVNNKTGVLISDLGSFLGGLLGGFATLIAVVKTIKNEETVSVRKSATIVYYDFKFALEDLIKSVTKAEPDVYSNSSLINNLINKMRELYEETVADNETKKNIASNKKTLPPKEVLYQKKFNKDEYKNITFYLTEEEITPNEIFTDISSLKNHINHIKYKDYIDEIMQSFQSELRQFYFDSDWIKTVAELRGDLPDADIKLIYQLYGDFMTIKQSISSTESEKEKAFAAISNVFKNTTLSNNTAQYIRKSVEDTKNTDNQTVTLGDVIAQYTKECAEDSTKMDKLIDDIKIMKTLSMKMGKSRKE